MSTLIPRDPYSTEEISKLYPKDLQLELVHVLFRHGERTPSVPHFEHIGLHRNWPYCESARQLAAAVATGNSTPEFGVLKFQRLFENFGANDAPTVASGPRGAIDKLCKPGELTDTGRATTLKLGERLRDLYVSKLNFMPPTIESADDLYLRSSHLPRALETLQQVFWGFYPPSTRAADFANPKLVTREATDETLYPNRRHCQRLRELAQAFGRRTAERWNNTEDMEYLNQRLAKYMPKDSPRVAVDSHPRLYDIMDMVNSSAAHGAETRFPEPFFDPKAREIMEKICKEEWFSGYVESREYRTLGVGSLLADAVGRMMTKVEQGPDSIPGDRSIPPSSTTPKSLKLALIGCHDTTLAATMSSLGAFEKERWPSYTSHLAIELFRDPAAVSNVTSPSILTKAGSWLSGSQNQDNEAKLRRPFETLSERQKQQAGGYYVRVRYNDHIVQIPGCKRAGKHFKDDTSLCTLEAFKRIVDDFTPVDWRKGCASNLGQSAFPSEDERAGGDRTLG